MEGRVPDVEEVFPSLRANLLSRTALACSFFMARGEACHPSAGIERVDSHQLFDEGAGVLLRYLERLAGERAALG